MAASSTSKEVEVEVKEGGVKAAGSSGSSEGCSKSYGGAVDDKKRRRMESNRESARRSRQKKQQHLDDLIKQVGGLTRDNGEIQKKIKQVCGIFDKYEAQNKLLKAEKHRLAAKLDSLESIIDINKVFLRDSPSTTANYNNGNGDYQYCMYGNGVSNYNNGDVRMKPWQLPSPSMPLIASSGLHYSLNF